MDYGTGSVQCLMRLAGICVGGSRLATLIGSLIIACRFGPRQSILVGVCCVVVGYLCAYFGTCSSVSFEDAYPTADAIVTQWSRSAVDYGSGWIFMTMLVRNLQQSDAVIGLAAWARSAARGSSGSSELVGVTRRSTSRTLFRSSSPSSFNLTRNQSTSMLKAPSKDFDAGGAAQHTGTPPTCWMVFLAHPCSLTKLL